MCGSLANGQERRVFGEPWGRGPMNLRELPGHLVADVRLEGRRQISAVRHTSSVAPFVSRSSAQLITAVFSGRQLVTHSV